MSIAIGATARSERDEVDGDQRYGYNKGAAQGRFYAGLSDSDSAFRSLLDGFAAGDRVLQIGCGVDSIGFELAARGVEVVGIDVSAVAVEQAALAAGRQGLDSASFRIMRAEVLEWPPNSFDGVIGSAVLHRVDVACTFAETSRVLRPGGVAAFLEPLGHNFVINRHRRRTRAARMQFEHPLRKEDFSLGSRYFGHVNVETHHLLSILTSPISDRFGGRTVHRVAAACDRVLLRHLSWLRWHAWIAVVELRVEA